MLSNSNVLVTIDSKEPPAFMLPVAVSDGKLDRKSTVFHLVSENNVVSVMGTFDEICDYAASIMGAMFSWPLVNGIENWFTDDENALPKKVVSHGNDGTVRNIGSSHGGSSGDTPDAA